MPQSEYIQTVDAGVKTVYALYRESGRAESRVEMQAVKWAAEGMGKGERRVGSMAMIAEYLVTWGIR